MNETSGAAGLALVGAAACLAPAIGTAAVAASGDVGAAAPAVGGDGATGAIL
ncbi:MAG: hypothetical protein WBY94_02725 [Polyangiaceae bacterium]